MILISFDIDGTLDIGDPPGVLTMDMVRIVQKKGFLSTDIIRARLLSAKQLL